jgi:peptide/nickel transport system substrate-binding protein
LLTGEVDMMTNVSVEDASRAPTIVASDSSIQFYRIQLNNRDGVTADVRVRQALNYAIDKEGMIKAFFNGQAALDNCQSLAPGMTGYNPSLKAYPYDLAKAKALVKEAGAEGMKIEIYQAADRWSKGLEIVQAVAQMWGAAGIQTTVRNVPFTQWLEVAQRQPGPRPDSFFVGANLRLQDAIDLRGYLTSDPRIGTISSVSDPIIDKMLVDFGAIDDEAARDKAFQGLTAKICRDATFAYLFAPKILTGVSKGVSFAPDPRNDRWYKVSEFTFSK